MTRQPENKAKPTAPLGMAKCPVCSVATDESVETFPFCSPRCRKIDLGRWLDEGYRISRPIEQRDLEEGVD